MKEVNPAPADPPRKKKLFLAHSSFVPEVTLTSAWQLETHAVNGWPTCAVDLILEAFNQGLPEIVLIHTRNIQSRMRLVEDNTFGSYCFLAIVDLSEGNEGNTLATNTNKFLKENNLHSSYFNVWEHRP